MSKMKYAVGAFVFALAVGSFALQNTATVAVDFLLWSMQTSVAAVVLGSAAFGGGVFLFLALGLRFKMQRKIRRMEGQLKQWEAENQLLRHRLAEHGTVLGAQPMQDKAEDHSAGR